MTLTTKIAQQSAICANLASVFQQQLAGALDADEFAEHLHRVIVADLEEFDVSNSGLLFSYLEAFSKNAGFRSKIEAIKDEAHRRLEQKYQADPSNYGLLFLLAQIDIKAGNIERGRRRLEKAASSGFSVCFSARDELDKLTTRRLKKLNDATDDRIRPLFALIDANPDASQHIIIEALRRYARLNRFALKFVFPSVGPTQQELSLDDGEIIKADWPEFFKIAAQGALNDADRIVFLSSPPLLAEPSVKFGDCIILDLRGCQDNRRRATAAALRVLTEKRFGGTAPGSVARLSLISSLFRTEDFIDGFVKNISLLEEYSEICTHFFLFSHLSEIECNVLSEHFSSFKNAIFIWQRKDPGLYECWNLAARLSTTPYISNANVDDLRHPRQVKALVAALDENERASVAAASLSPFETYQPDYQKIPTDNAWYRNLSGPFGFKDLASVEKKNGEFVLVPNCIPHCMPVWRRELHDLYGYFDEKTYGTYADWAFWLRAFRGGEEGVLVGEALSFYFVNPESHNRRGNKLEYYHKAVEAEFLQDYVALNEARPVQSSKSSNGYEKKLNTHGRDQLFGAHRNSFSRLIHALEPLDCGPGGIDFIPFIERTFVWGSDPGEAASECPKPLSADWVGVLHVPFDAPPWFKPEVSPETIFKTEMWRRSLPVCRGIIGLSKEIIADFKMHYPGIPTMSVLHPTELEVQQFSFDQYQERKRLVQAGDWLRKLQSIFQIRAPGHERIMLLKDGTNLLLEKEIAHVGDFRNEDVAQLNFVSNDEYDSLLSSAVVLCMLYGTAANNLIIECMARATPIIVNPLPSVVEYLGRNYPLYAETLEEAEKALMDEAVIRASHQYLLERTQQLNLSYDDFLRAVGESEFYQSL